MLRKLLLFIVIFSLFSALYAQQDGAETLGDSLTPELGNGGIDVLHYDLALFVDPERPFLKGTATLTIALTQANLGSFTLDLRDFMSVSAVRVDDVVAEFEQSARKLRVFLPDPNAAQVRVAIDYSGQPQAVDSPYFPLGRIGIEYDYQRPALAMVTEPDAANTWFPGNDHPIDTATFDFYISVPPPYTAVANGTPLAVEESATARTFHWQMSYPMTTYLATLAVAEYALIEDTAPNGIPLRHYVFADADLASAARVFSGTGRALEILEGYFGAYPYDSYGHVVTPMRGGALETQTMTVMPVDVLFVGSESAIWALVVHELAHQWFGNRVRLGAWSDIWLNEGFATLAEWLADEVRYSPQRATRSREDAQGRIAQGGRKTPLAHPRPAEMFGNDSYEKGAWVLHMLRVELGDAAFFAMLRDYLQVFADIPITTDLFFEFLDEHTGRDWAGFRQQWLEQPALPRFSLYWMPTATGVSLRVCSEEEAQRYTFAYPLLFSGGGGAAALLLDFVGGDAVQHFDADFALDFPALTLQPDPDESILDAITAQKVDALPLCDKSF